MQSEAEHLVNQHWLCIRLAYQKVISSSYVSMGLEVPFSLSALNLEAPVSANLWMAKDSEAESLP